MLIPLRVTEGDRMRSTTANEARRTLPSPGHTVLTLPDAITARPGKRLGDLHRLPRGTPGQRDGLLLSAEMRPGHRREAEGVSWAWDVQAGRQLSAGGPYTAELTPQGWSDRHVSQQRGRQADCKLGEDPETCSQS